jgi:1-acyl-sn-glycerol-3-phosphate acyltransferase
MASKTGVPIVPIWIDGTWEAYPIHYRFPRPRQVTLTFGQPISPDDLPDGMIEKDRRRLLLEFIKSAFETMRDSSLKS